MPCTKYLDMIKWNEGSQRLVEVITLLVFCTCSDLDAPANASDGQFAIHFEQFYYSRLVIEKISGLENIVTWDTYPSLVYIMYYWYLDWVIFLAETLYVVIISILVVSTAFFFHTVFPVIRKFVIMVIGSTSDVGDSGNHVHSGNLAHMLIFISTMLSDVAL